MTPNDWVQAIYAVGGTAFILLLVLAVTTTGGRVIYYRRHGKARPRLLTRDVLVKGGLATSFVLITIIRFLPLDVRLALTQGNIAWALATTVPAVFAMAVYCWYELAVIERDPR